MAENFNTKPYFDDYDERKGFHKILFKPSYAVQARELNQLQEILQQQISRVGTHLFKQGSLVLGQSKLNSDAQYVLLKNVDGDPELIKKLDGVKLTQDVDGNALTATVLMAKAEGDLVLAVVRYQNSATKTVAGEVQNVTAFSKDLALEVADQPTTKVAVAEKGGNNEPATGPAIFLVVESGVFYIDGYFVYTPRQQTLIGWNKVKSLSAKAGFSVEKGIKTAYDDKTLFDNAAGSPNEAAVGADRFYIGLNLVTTGLEEEAADFIELVRYEDGALRVAKLNTQYNTLEDTLARRTYDESGDYAVHGLDIRVVDHLKDDAHPTGFKTKEEGGDDNKLAIEITAGKAYVKGYEVENLASLYLTADKARTTDSVKVATNVIQSNENGEYVYLAPGNQFIDISKHPVLWLTTGQENTADIMGYVIPKYVEAISISGQTIFKLFGSFHLSQSQTYGWQHLGGWKLDDLRNGPILQKVTLQNVVSTFKVDDGLPLTSHSGWTPYAWDRANSHLFVKKSKSAAPFDKSVQVQKAPASGYATGIRQKESYADGTGDLVKMDVANVKTTKDAAGNFELTTPMGFTATIRTNAQGYGVYDHLGNGVFVGRPVAAHTGVDNAYFSNIVNIENDGKRLVINNVQYPNATFAISAQLQKAVSIRSKTLAEGFTLIKSPSDRHMVLAHKDVYNIKHVYMSKNKTTEPKDSDTDVSQYYELVNNDTLDFYQNTLLKAKSGFAAPAGQIKVVYEYFLHSAGEAFTVDSYESLKDNPTDDNDVTHIGRIPVFRTKEKAYILSDYLDFRQSPRDGFFILKGQIKEGEAMIKLEHDYSNVIGIASRIHADGFESDTIVNSVDKDGITASKNASKTATVYVVVNGNGVASAAEPFSSALTTWSAVAGQSIVYDASYFVDRWDRVVYYKNGEIKYVYGVPGITRYPDVPVDAMSLATLIVPAYTREAAYVKYVKDDNRRYTMRDIGQLERRIENLEYYTTLTMRELETKDMKITDTAGLDRFKSGFFVSDFSDFGVFSPFDGGFQATLIPEKNMLGAMEYSESIGLKLNRNSSTNYVVKGGKVFLPYSHVVEIEQPYATTTESINPYLIIKWNPQMTMAPASDSWMETKWEPTVTNVTNLTKTQTRDVVENNWRVQRVSQSQIASQFAGWSQIGPTNRNISTLVNYRESVTSVTQTHERKFTRFLGNSIIPYMRSRVIRFTVKGAKPNTRYWATFDATDVNQWCRPVNGQWGAALISDNMGTVEGEFELPPNTFSSGTKTFALADVNVLKFPDAATECEASANYRSTGVLVTMQEQIDRTNVTTNTVNRINSMSRVTVVKDGNSSQFDLGFNRQQQVGDPLAQSFFTKDIQSAGMYATKIDLFFETKDPEAPVFIELREMVNGMPSSERIAGTMVAVAAADVKVSKDSTVATSFEFDAPVWLPSGKEFCIVVFGDSAKYRVFISRMGEKVINEDRIVGQQPSMGSLFKSQNATTWTPFQLEDLKFRIHRAKFNTSVSGDWKFENNGKAATRKVLLSAFRTTAGSRFLTIEHPNHGMAVNDIVKISAESAVTMIAESADAATIFNGIRMSEVYGNQIVKTVNGINSYTIEVATPATVTGKFEDVGRYVYIESNINYNQFRLVTDTFNPPEAEVRYFANLITGKDFDGGQTPKVKLAEFQIKDKDDNALQDVCLVQTADNETSKSMMVRCAVKTGNNYVSPMMSLDDNNVVVASLALNKPENDKEEQPEGGIAASKVVTQTIRLKAASDTLRVYTSENKATNDDIEVWYRTSVNRDIETKGWTKMEPVASQVAFDNDTFTEHERRVEGIPEFDEFQLKIVLKGTNSARRPALKELRAIAVAG